MTIKFIKKVIDAIPFAYQRDGDACMDIYSANEMIVPSKSCTLVDSGIAVEIPKGYEGVVRGRSGLALKGLMVHIGTIDSNYRGSVGVIVYNSLEEEFYIPKHSRIAQFTIKPIIEVALLEAKELSSSNRGEQGYGSSGYENVTFNRESTRD